MQRALPGPGSAVVIRREVWRVERTVSEGPVVRIDAVKDGARGVERATFFTPFESVTSPRYRRAATRVRRQRWRAALDHVQAHAASAMLPLAALTARIDLAAYQLEPVLAVLDGHRRILIADDVGLGKTIQAALAAAELVARGADRVLIVAPASLIPQWMDELARRFGMTPREQNAETLRHATSQLPAGISPWSIGGIHITSPDFVKQPHVRDALPDDPWDLLVVDEAHAVCGDSERHDVIEAIAARARVVLCLTATPHSGDERPARALAALGRFDTDDLVVFRRSRADAAMSGRRHVRRLRFALCAEETRALNVLDSFCRAARDAAGPDAHEATELLIAVLAKRALSTFAALVRSIDRRLAHLDGAGPPSLSAAQGVFDFGDDVPVLDMTIGLAVDRERNWLRRLRSLAVAAAERDSRLRCLRRAIARAQEPAIVFTEFLDTAAAAAASLAAIAPVRVAHGQLSPREFAAALDDFARGRAAVLVATDAASQGLNLQGRCRWVIHVDRPWNPVRLEQRAGRVDRIGQARVVHVTELVARHPADVRLAARVDAKAAAAAGAAAFRGTSAWRRRAAAAARILAARRVRAGAWRGPGRPAVRGRTMAARRCGAVARRIAIATIGASGRVVEQRVIVDVARRADGAGGGARGDQRVGAGAPVIATTRARIRRLARWRAGALRRALATERELAARLDAAADVEPLLPGLGAIGEIDARAAARAAARAHVALHIAALERALAAPATGLEAGAPYNVLVER